MSDSSDEDAQQTLGETPPEPDPEETVQERILSLYRSDQILQTTVGFWAKILVEMAIVAVPLLFLGVLPAAALTSLGGYPEITTPRIVLAWATFVTTVVGFTWCFTEATVER